ncbi:hypothetical protein LUZ60_016266 [Juncus effusus]|nr:hypothetical protein LUZ60_016266 [Juncus effusus]
MAGSAVRDLSAPLMVINLILYITVIGYASWDLNHFINGQSNLPDVGGNQATVYFLQFAILASVVGVASSLANANHINSWRSDTLPLAASSTSIAWAITSLAFGFACKEIRLGGSRGWRLRVVEACITILAATQLLHVLLLHVGMFDDNYLPNFHDANSGISNNREAKPEPQPVEIS